MYRSKNEVNVSKSMSLWSGPKIAEFVREVLELVIIPMKWPKNCLNWLRNCEGQESSRMTLLYNLYAKILSFFLTCKFDIILSCRSILHIKVSLGLMTCRWGVSPLNLGIALIFHTEFDFKIISLYKKSNGISPVTGVFPRGMLPFYNI